ncbi:MAG: TonB family protein [bacterium]
MNRELLFSFAGHALLILVATLAGTRVVRDTRRPAVIAVQLPAGGTPQPQPQPKVEKAEVVESKPKSQLNPKPAPAKPKEPPKEDAGQVKRFGLGVNVEGAQALGYSYYLTRMLEAINSNWLNPYAGQAINRTATVMFTIARDGTIRDVAVEKPSGDRAYDLACERAVKVTEKLPPLPSEFTGQQLKLHLEFEQKP